MTVAAQEFDVLVAGAGPAGMIAAVAFAGAGHRVLCVDPSPPVVSQADPGSDLRTTALLQPSRDFLETCGLWSRLAAEATELRVMRIVDAGGQSTAPRLARDFDAADLGEAPFGWNLPNWLIRRELLAALEAMPGVTLRTGSGVDGLVTRDDGARVRLTDGSRVAVRLVVGADGRSSAVRAAAGMGARTIRYGQKALAFAVTHDEPHGNVSTEIHRSGGPFTLVPLPDRGGRPCSAVVWMERAAEARRLYDLDDAAFSAAATARSGGLQGPLTVTGGRRIWPIISQTANRLTVQRVALVAEAAHVVPPIGAQGMNMSIADIRALCEAAGPAPADPGRAEALAAYVRARRADVALRVGGIDLLNRVSMLEPRPLRDLRRFGIAALYAPAPVRRTLMQLGLGARG